MLSLCINAVCFSCFLSLRLSHTHTHTQVHSVLVFTLPSVCVFIYFYIHFSSSHTGTAAILADWLFICLSFLTLLFFPIPSLLLSHFSPSSFFSVSVSFLVSVFHSPQPRPLSLSFCCTLSSLSFFRSLIPRCPSLPLFFPSHSFFISLYLSSLRSISHSPFLSLPSFTCFLNHPFSLTHLLFFSVSFSLPLSDCFKSSNYKLHGYQGIQVPLLISCSLSLCTPPPPHTHTHNLFSFYFPCLCLSVFLSLSVAPSLFPLCMVVFLNLKSILCSFLFFKNKSRYQLVRGDNVC